MFDRIKYLRSSNQRKFGIFFAYFNMFISFIINMLYTPVMLRILGQNDYGLFNLVASVISYLGIINFGFGSSYIKYYSKFKQAHDELSIKKLNGLFISIFSILAVVVMILGFIISYFSRSILGNQLSDLEISKAQVLIIVMAFSMSISFIDIVFTSFLRALEKFIEIQFFELLKVIVNPFLILPLLLLGYGSIGLAFGLTFLNIVITLIHIIYSFKRFNFSVVFKNYPDGLIKNIVFFSSFIFLNLLIDQVYWNVDKFLLGRILGTASVAIYSLASQFNIYYIRISNVVSGVFVSRVHSLIYMENSKNNLSKLFAKVGRIQFLILILILTGFIFFGKPFIFWWAGSDYIDSYWIIIVLLSTITVDVIQNLGIEIQRSMNKHKFRSIVFLIIAVFNIGITIPLISLWGPIGASIGTAISLIIGNIIIMNFYYQKVIGLDMVFFWKEIFKIFPSLIIPLAFGIYIYINIDIYIITNFIIFTVLYTIVYSLFVLLFGLNQFEKNLIIKGVSVNFRE